MRTLIAKGCCGEECRRNKKTAGEPGEQDELSCLRTGHTQICSASSLIVCHFISPHCISLAGFQPATSKKIQRTNVTPRPFPVCGDVNRRVVATNQKESTPVLCRLQLASNRRDATALLLASHRSEASGLGRRAVYLFKCHFQGVGGWGGGAVGGYQRTTSRGNQITHLQELIIMNGLHHPSIVVVL